MRTKASYLALLGECLTLPALLWIFTITLFLKDAPEPFPEMVWTLLLASAAYLVYVLFLQKPRSIPAIAVVSTVLFGLQIVSYILLYRGEVTFGFVLAAILISAVTAYACLYYCMREPMVVKHLFFLDILVLGLVWMYLFISVIHVSIASQICSFAVILLNVGGLIALRMSEDGESEGIGRAFALAAGSAGALAAVVFLLIRLFSRSGEVTGAFLDGIRRFFLMIWHAIEAFAEWLSSHFDPSEAAEAPEMAPMPGGIQETEGIESVPINPVSIAVVIGVIIAVAAICIVICYRRNKAGISFGKVKMTGTDAVRRKKQKKSGRFAVILEKLIFLKNALLYRNTPKGVLVWLEKTARRRKIPRQAGESVREFIFRLSPQGELKSLADDLDAVFYGGRAPSLTAVDCKNIRKVFKNSMRSAG